ncbi:MAG: hypothetical protein JWO05_2412 [Gemmatimonadetes bacterium]|nr:hypothetical protein [Gemmatimonadota bacterium]
MTSAGVAPDAGVHRERITAALLGVLAAAFAAWILAGVAAAAPVGSFYDDGFYVALARSIATGGGFHTGNLPGAPPSTHYPPGYPLVLALLWHAAPFPAVLATFLLFNAACMGAVAAGAYWLARRVLALSVTISAVVAIAGAVSIPPMLLGAVVLSESLFLAMLLPLLVLAERFTQRDGVREAVLLAVVAGAATLVRTQGIALLPAVALVYVLRGRRREAAAFAGVFVAVVLPWLIWQRAYGAQAAPDIRGQYEPYSAWLVTGMREGGLPFLWKVVVLNLRGAVEIIIRPLAVSSIGIARAIALVAVVVTVIPGVLAWKRRAPVSLLFLAAYLAMVIAWPFSPLRFIWGAWVLVLLVIGAGVHALRSDSQRALRMLGTTAAVVVVLGGVMFSIRGYTLGWWRPVNAHDAMRFTEATTWISSHVPAGDVVATESEAAVTLYTGRRAVPVTSFTAAEYIRHRSPAENVAILDRIIAAYDARWVVVMDAPMRAVSRALTAGPSPRLVRVDSTASLEAFRRLR